MENIKLEETGVKPTKTCRVCDVVLVAGSTATNPKGNCYPSNMKLGKRICNSCTKDYIREKEKENRKVKQVGDNQHLRDMMEGARDRARKNNIPYDLSIHDLRNLVTDKCPILGIKFELNKQGQAWGKGKGKNNWQTSPSLDRIIPEKGYVKDNIIIVSLMANSIKNQATPKQILTVGNFYKKLYKEKGISNVR